MPEHPLPMKIPQVLTGRCRACRRCLARGVCRSKALMVIEAGEPPWVDGNRCYGCLACIPACPFGAIVAEPSTGETP